VELAVGDHRAVGVTVAVVGRARLKRFENWKRARAAAWPYFLRSFLRGSRVTYPTALSFGRSSRSIFMSARVMPWRTAPACDEIPPPRTVAWTSYWSRRPTSSRGWRMTMRAVARLK
jgi:hypothetical protein